jgi:5-formyltetrahydrofolate cyclo-ligase
MTKSALRRSFLARRQLLTPDERETASAQIIANFFSNFDLSEVRFLHCFIPIEQFGEVDTRPLFQRIWSQYPHIQTVVPRVDHEKNQLESLRYDSGVDLVLNRWNISEPSHDQYVEPIDMDVVLVPLLCFDRTGHRVGYGKGFYDGFLRRCRADCQKVGLSIFEPVDEISDSHETDVRLDSCVTPDRLFVFQK